MCVHTRVFVCATDTVRRTCVHTAVCVYVCICNTYTYINILYLSYTYMCVCWCVRVWT